MKKKVWILNHYAGNMFFDKGGRHYNFAKYLKQFGYDPVIFSANSKHGVKDKWFETDALWHEHLAEEIGVPFVYVHARTYVGNGKQRIFNMMDFYRNVKKTAKEYAKQHGKPDIIYASSVHPLTLVAGLQLAKHFGVKCICEVRDLWPESLVAYGIASPNNPAVIALRCLEKWIYKKADHVIMTWPGGYDYIREQEWDREIPESKVTHIGNGVDLSVFLDNIRQFHIEDLDLQRRDIKKIIYAGSIRKVNNLQILVDAAEILQRRNVKNIRFLIWGDGDERANLEQQVAEKKLDLICFKGQVAKKYVPSLLAQGDISVLHNSSTSLDRFGQSQNKFFEYLAAGRPVFMTYSVGHSICKEKNCGIELDVQSPEAIADAIEQFAGLSEAQCNEYANCASTAVKDYDFVYLTQKLIYVIEEV